MAKEKIILKSARKKGTVSRSKIREAINYANSVISTGSLTKLPKDRVTIQPNKLVPVKVK